MDYAFLVLIAAVVAGGAAGGVLRVWSLTTRIHSLEVAVAQLQGQLTKSVKTVAAMSRWGKPDKLEQEAGALIASQNGQNQANLEPVSWWK